MILKKNMYRENLELVTSFVDKLVINWKSFLEISETAGDLYAIGPASFSLLLDQTICQI